MSRKGSWDNARSETLSVLLKVERLHAMRLETIHQAKDDTLNWRLWYNRTRLHLTLNYVTPMQLEQRWTGSQEDIAA